MARNKSYINRSLQKTIKKWMLKASLHGVSNISQSKNLAVKILWTFLFLALIVFSGCLLYILISLFLKHEIVTTLKHERKNELKYPAITFCNLQYLNARSKFISSDLKHLLADYTSTEDIIQTLQDHPEPFKSFFNSKEKYLKSLVKDDIMQVGFEMDEMLLGCFFMGSNCFKYEFKQVFSEKYGKCFTFKANKLRKKSVLKK